MPVIPQSEVLANKLPETGEDCGEILEIIFGYFRLGREEVGP